MTPTYFVLVGGPHSGTRYPADPHQLEIQLQAPMALSEHTDVNGRTFHVTVLRYIRVQAHWADRFYQFYVWEHEIHRDPLDLLLGQLCHLRKGLDNV